MNNENPRGTLILLRGLPGSGKTTLALTLYDFLHYEDNYAEAFAADDYFMQNDDGVYRFDANQLSMAHEYCRKSTEDAMKRGVPVVIVHNTFTTEKEILPYRLYAMTHNYRFISLIVENRHEGTNIHNVPPEVLEKMKARFSVCL